MKMIYGLVANSSTSASSAIGFLIADPFTDFVDQSVGTVWVLDSTILLLISGNNGVLVEVHGSHLLPAITIKRDQIIDLCIIIANTSCSSETHESIF
jgi:hypothetical protein